MKIKCNHERTSRGPTAVSITVCCIKGDCIFISGIEIVGADTSGGGINSVVEEMKKLDLP